MLFGCCSTVIVADPTTDGIATDQVCTSTRLPGRCKPAPLSRRDNVREKRIPGNSLEVTRKITIPEQQLPQEAAACDAEFSISYWQVNDRVKVDASVENQACIASHGEFDLRIRTKDAAGEISTRSFTESWSRRSEGTIQLTRYYPMAGANDLIWVMVNPKRKTACICD